jgi:hypothetical protein
MSGQEELAFLKDQVSESELSPAVLRQLRWDILAAKRGKKPRLPPRLKGRANDPPASPVGANLELSRGGCGLPEGWQAQSQGVGLV